MKLLNLGCGGTRPGAPWTNIDNLSTQLLIGSPERSKLDSEPNYIDSDITRDLPLSDETFDAVLLSHVVEHFSVPEAIEILRESLRVLKPGGIIIVSVPDASHFRKVYNEDRVENWPRLFGVTDPKNTIQKFFTAALFFDQHKAVLTDDSLWCYLVHAGFDSEKVGRLDPAFAKAKGESKDGTLLAEVCAQLNRFEHSLFMMANK